MEMNTEQLTNFIKNISSKYNIPVQELNSIKDAVEDNIKDNIKDSVKATYNCRCGSVIKNEARGIKRHENTKKHLEFIKKNEIPDIVTTETEVEQTEQQSQADEDVENILNELVEEAFGVEEAAEEAADESADEAAGMSEVKHKQEDLHIGYCEVCCEHNMTITKKRQFFSYHEIFGQCCLTCYDKFVLVEEDDMWYLQQKDDFLISIDNEFLSYRDVNLVYGLHPREHIDEKTTKKRMIEILRHYAIRVKRVAAINKKELYDWIKNEFVIDNHKKRAVENLKKGPPVYNQALTLPPNPVSKPVSKPRRYMSDEEFDFRLKSYNRGMKNLKV